MIVKLSLAALLAGAAYFAAVDPVNSDLLIAGLIVLCLVLGICLVMPIGGADMPVVVALLNSYSGSGWCCRRFRTG